MTSERDYGIRTTLHTPFVDALERTRRALAEQGFGVLSEIDLKQKLQEKVGADISDYMILGAYNPPLAHKALQAEQEIGLLLPCNVIVYDAGGGNTVVAAVDPEAMLSIVAGRSAVAEVARDARQRLTAAIRSLET